MICYPIKILVVDDNTDQLLLTERAFKRNFSETEVRSVKSGQACLETLSREEFSVVLVDYSLPNMDGMEIIRRIQEIGLSLPVIMVTGQGDERIAVRAMQAGASDYVVKTQGYLMSLPGIVEKAIERHELQNRLRISEEKYKRLAENANDLIFATDRFGNFTFLTNRVRDLLGYSVDELLGQSFKSVLAGDSREVAEKHLEGADHAGETQLVELDFVTKSGVVKSFELNLKTTRQFGRISAFEAIGRDITQRKQLGSELLERNNELTALLSVTSSITHSLNFQEIATAYLERILEFVPLDCAALVAGDHSNPGLQLFGELNLPAPFRQSLEVSDLLGDACRALEQATGPLTEPEENSEKPSPIPGSWSQACQASGIRTQILLPLFFKQKLLGIVFGGRYATAPFRTAEVRILSSTCNQISVGMANARLFTAIRDAKTEWETTFDAMSELICIQDLNGKIIRVNKPLARRLSREPHEVVNRMATTVFQEEASPWCIQQRFSGHERKRIVSYEYEDQQLGGFFEISTTPIFSSEGNLFGWLFVGKDISDQRQLQNQIVQVERLKALGEMASGVAHDFNNVLAGILGKTQVVLSKLEGEVLPDRESLRSDLKTIERKTIQGSQTVKRIQDFTRIRTDQQFSHVDMNQVIHEAVSIVRPIWKDQCESKGTKIEIEIIPGGIPPISGIPSELTEAMVNIVVNSIEAMPEGGSIRITTTPSFSKNSDEVDYVEVSINDDGVGMSNEVARKVFDPFFSTKGPQGTGLGMSVAYGIVTRHHGKIALESRLGMGTTCRMSLPVAKGREVPVSRSDPADLHPSRILIIDDEDLIRDFLTEMFKASGYQVDVAPNGPAGLSLFAKQSYDVVFSDLGLPEMSGWEVARRIKKQSPQTPVVLLSGWGIQLDDDRLQECGIDLVLSKPCPMEELLRAADEVLKRARHGEA